MNIEHEKPKNEDSSFAVEMSEIWELLSGFSEQDNRVIQVKNSIQNYFQERELVEKYERDFLAFCLLLLIIFIPGIAGVLADHRWMIQHTEVLGGWLIAVLGIGGSTLFQYQKGDTHRVKQLQARESTFDVLQTLCNRGLIEKEKGNRILYLMRYGKERNTDVVVKTQHVLTFDDEELLIVDEGYESAAHDRVIH